MSDVVTREEVKIEYFPTPTLQMFHEKLADFRCIVGPVGSGKTSAASWEICYYLPFYFYEKYKIKKTRWCVVRNTYPELRDTTMATVFEWFPFGQHKKQENTYIIKYPEQGLEVEVLFRSCDNPKDIKKFKSLDLTGFWIDESIEIADEIKRMLKNRVGRFPQKCPKRFGIETTNPPDIEHPTYYQFKWLTEVPGPIPNKPPLKKHYGFWQPPYENVDNLRPGYYDDLKEDYRDNPDWIDMYIKGKPGMLIRGKQVYNNFKKRIHVAEEPMIYSGGPLWVGWDDSGNSPAAVVLQLPSPLQVHILAEYYSDRMGIVDFGNYVVQQMNMMFPGHKEVFHWGDPAGEATYSKREGGFTSNAQLLYDNCEISVQSSEQNFQARVEAVDQMLARVDGVLIDPRCIRLINGFLGGYCYPENKAIVGEFLPNVLKNKYSHVHDALQYVMVKLFKPVHRNELEPGYKHREPADDYDPLTWGLKR